ncbi:MAG TPA: DUF4783 domain-containing protein [Niabella sp.]|nr:DUF4783 domain-containing protein [Niabella sp.]HOZ97394.1 DUF4783 domain-containing protein [Niabella sp.]HQW15238.1 DUF4783 domain-containing protein [Niabella sp.]HQX20294.1 DUF4783 domain-containing protein [Niabella sp.]HQX42801.1 DUF4783 domain-containing protein [Niabella sp.]
MKKIYSVLFVCFGLFFSPMLKAQSLDGVIGGLKNGNAAQVTDNAVGNFSLTILDKGNNYSKNQALQILKDFFTKNTPKGFDVKHKGNSPNGQYAIGTLATSNGNYRVNIFMKKEANKEVIKELRFQLIE